MELDLLGLGLLPATAGHADSVVQQADPEKAGSDEHEPLHLAAAMAETPPPVRARMRMRRRPVDTEGQDVPAPPASRRPKPPSSPQVRVPGAAGDRSPRASQLGFFRAMFPSAPGDLAAAGHAQVHDMATIAPPPPPPLLGLSSPAANGSDRPPPFAAWPIFEGSPAVSGSNPDHPTAPMTFIYAGSVRAFDSVPVEQAEKIVYMTTKDAQATETPAFQMPQPAAAQQMMMLLGLANANDSLLPKRTASLARFLHKRKQRVENAAAMPCPCGEAALPVPAQIDNSTAVHARENPFGDVEQPRGASEDGPKSMKENHGEEEAVNTDLKM